jgi:hypothetical protein
LIRLIKRVFESVDVEAVAVCLILRSQEVTEDRQADSEAQVDQPAPNEGAEAEPSGGEVAPHDGDRPDE